MIFLFKPKTSIAVFFQIECWVWAEKIGAQRRSSLLRPGGRHVPSRTHARTHQIKGNVFLVLTIVLWLNSGKVISLYTWRYTEQKGKGSREKRSEGRKVDVRWLFVFIFLRYDFPICLNFLYWYLSTPWFWQNLSHQGTTYSGFCSDNCIYITTHTITYQIKKNIRSSDCM